MPTPLNSRQIATRLKLRGGAPIYDLQLAQGNSQMWKGWFGPKRIGWGVSPRSWQGWVVTAIFIAIVAASMRWLRPALEESTRWPPVTLTLGIIAVWLALFCVTVWLTYDKGDNAR